jgi:hypothetical protein
MHDAVKLTTIPTRTVLMAVALSACTLIGGCGTDRRAGTAHLQGTVTINGQPLPDDAQANVTFAPASKGRTAGAVITNGEYDCPDAPLGKVKAYFSVMRPTGRTITETDNRPYAEVGSIIASKYASGIDLDVSGDNANQDFDLEPAQQ